MGVAAEAAARWGPESERGRAGPGLGLEGVDGRPVLPGRSRDRLFCNMASAFPRTVLAGGESSPTGPPCPALRVSGEEEVADNKGPLWGALARLWGCADQSLPRLRPSSHEARGCWFAPRPAPTGARPGLAGGNRAGLTGFLRCLRRPTSAPVPTLNGRKVQGLGCLIMAPFERFQRCRERRGPRPEGPQKSQITAARVPARPGAEAISLVDAAPAATPSPRGPRPAANSAAPAGFLPGMQP